MSQKRIEQWEIDRYWEIFSTLSNGGTHLDGAQAASVLKNSQLREDQLERIWDLADVDNDGRLDFEEFCVAMRLIFDLVNGEYSDVPQSLPDWLVPESKAHLVQATRALTNTQPAFESVSDDEDDGTPGLKNGFDWYMAPGDKSKYEEIYTANRSANGDVAFNSLSDLYDSLDVPDTDVRSAWNLVNPQARSAIGKDATLAFLHILNGRHSGFRIPRTVPPSLRATFERGNIEYNVDRVGEAQNKERWATRSNDETMTGKKAKFGDAYLTRLGVGDRAGAAYNKKTEFQGETTKDWEEVRLKKQLRELEDKMKAVEEQAARGKGGRRREDSSKPALVKRELEQLLDYKRRELREVEDGTGSTKEGQNLKSVRDDIETVREQVVGLETHWKERERVLDELRREIEDVKAGA